jgi:superfamily II DNA or RNA helicase
MRRLPALRPWQRAALEQFEASKKPDFLAVATPGAGKTVFALMAARRALVARDAARLVIVVPTAHLKAQWADAAEALGLLLEPAWASTQGLPADMHGIVVTYQQAAATPEALAKACAGAFAILDEIHHAGESRAWGDAIRIAVGPARRRLCISGTPFRSDDSAIPFVRYSGVQAEPDFEYGYGDALRDRAVVRPVYFPRVGGHLEWRASDGLEFACSFEDPIGRARAGQRLRTALSLEGDWLPSVLAEANRQLERIREEDPDAGGLVIASDQVHARGIAELLRHRVGVRAAVATSDDPAASGRIAEFRDSREPWIVAVRMVSEGVDIPRLRVGVYATTTTTDLFFRQAVGRLVRWERGKRGQKAFLFIPDDARLRGSALDIKRSRRHALKPPDEEEREVLETAAEEAEPPAAEQLNLFSVIAARALTPDGSELGAKVWWDDEETHAQEDAWQPAEEEPELEVAPVPLPETSGPAPGASPPRSARARRQQLRDRNSDSVDTLVRITRKGHAEINRMLNRRVGLKRISEATERQLEARLREAERWIQSPVGR